MGGEFGDRLQCFKALNIEGDRVKVMSRYLIIVETANGNFSAYSPDVLGCVATGSTREEAEVEMRAALQLHLKGMREDGVTLPIPSTSIGYVEA
jgi:predicted RNase H-like HicB family nuclease